MHKPRSALEEAIGRQAVAALAAKFPGQRIYVPWQNPDAQRKFMDNFSPLIGAEGVAQLVDHYGGLRIVVPSKTTPKRKRGYVPVSMERVVELTREGLTAKQIAQLLTCNPRTVHKVRTKARKLGRLPRKRKARRKRK